jgi:2-polyprenyl-3-methyl-5-hydroxy-6-metoxy-1,4-benzoquinol methylase
MDDPVLDVQAHRAALEALARLNRVSGAERLIWREICRLSERTGKSQLRLLDVATGGGDLPIALFSRAKRVGFALEIDACDISGQAIEEACNRAMKANATINFFQLDALNQTLPTGYDVVTTSLFTHHLEPSQVLRLLANMKRAARELVLIDDLERSLINLILVSVATYVLTSSPVARHDGPASVRGSYTQTEMKQLAEKARLNGAQTYTHFPCRFLLSWSHNQNASDFG